MWITLSQLFIEQQEEKMYELHISVNDSNSNQQTYAQMYKNLKNLFYKFQSCCF